MKRVNDALARGWTLLGPRFLPFADAATTELPLGRLLRLSLFQVSVGMALVLLIGTLNRVMIVELDVPASLVALMVALPLVFAPFRALVGFRSDTHKSVLGWRRVPYIWIGTLLQFGGLAIMPFALIGAVGRHARPDHHRAARRGTCIPAGRRRHAYRRRRSDWRWPPTWRRRNRSRKVVGLLYVMLLLGMVVSAVLFGVAAAQLHGNSLDPGHPGHGAGDDGAEHDRAVEAGGARSVAHRAEPRAPDVRRVVADVRARQARQAAAWSRWALAPPRSAWKTSCSNPTADRSCT